MSTQNQAGNTSAIGFVKNLTKFSIATWIGFFIGFLSVPFTTRLFTPDQVGVINMFTYISNLFIMVLILGVDQAYVRHYNEPPQGKTAKHLLVVSLQTVFVATLAAAGVGLFFFSRPISLAITGSEQPMIPWLLFVFILASMFLRFLNLNNRMIQNSLAFTIQSVMIVVTTKVLYLAAAFWNPTYQGAILLIVLGTAALAIVYFFIQYKELKCSGLILDIPTSRELLKFGLPLMPAAVLIWLNSSLSSLLLRNFISFEAVGIYSSALSVASLLNVVQTGFNTYWVAFVYSNYKTEQRKIIRIHDYITFGMVLLGLCIILFQDVIFFLIGKNFHAAKPIFSFLLIYPICYTISETTGLGIWVSKKTHLSLIPAVSNIGLNATFSLLLLPKLGMSAVAIGSSIAGLSMLLVRTVIGEKYYKCVQNYSRTVCALVILCLATTFSYFLYASILLRSMLVTVLTIVLIVLYWKDARYLLSVTQEIVKRMTRVGRRA